MLLSHTLFMKKVTAIVDREKCHPGRCQHECMTYDPLNRSGEKGFHLGPSGKSEIDESVVTEMHKICAKMCPFDAIKIINLPEALNKKPIHQYGRNLFRLYNLPIPIFGKVIGTLGVNGIGKSTAIKILAGVLKPNLGNLEKEATYEELIEYFKGPEAQLFFEKIHKNEINVSYKPQQVELIAKTQKGKVKTLLKKVDEKGQFDEIIEKLQLQHILETDISKVSGGELQRVAIAATVLKKANLYIFDEPTSYLDVKQRIQVSKFIRELATPDVAVVVVEHDLIILDYMTDMIHIMYGSEGGFGVVSQPKTTKAGINIYLSGYIKEENMRFRDKEIKFLRRPPEKKTEGTSLTSWKDIQIRLGNFNLSAEEGELFKKDVVGVLGENGIGQTSFIKVLARELKPDKGSITEKIKVSYKPQYLQSDSKDTVAEVLKDILTKYKTQMINPLTIKPLLNKKLNELSGGELQRVSIALCLGTDADLYLLDEPSAYLDVEQRLIISKTIRNFIEHKGKTTIIVDHDLLFLDYLSEKLMVFEGTPAKEGSAKGPFSMQEGMNLFLKKLNITFRRDPESNRPRVNKEESVKDREQKSKGQYYYV